LGYLEVNSFYRAFRRWTGLTYSEYKTRHCL
jgi:AraC family mar-sox-rob regulon transcriptional activator